MNIQWIRKGKNIFPVSEQGDKQMAGFQVNTSERQAFESINAAKRKVRSLGGFKTVRVAR